MRNSVFTNDSTVTVEFNSIFHSTMIFITMPSSVDSFAYLFSHDSFSAVERNIDNKNACSFVIK